MNIFKFQSYKKYILSYVKSLPNGGRGELSKIARALRIHNTTLSQVLKGSKNINLEQALELTNYLILNERETEYLLMLVSYERAGSIKLKKYLLSQIVKLKNDANTKLVFEKLPESELSEESKSTFYSFWGYSGIRVLCSIPGKQTVEAISTYLGLSNKKVKKILDFLVEKGLCIRQNDKFLPGPAHTHISANDTFIGPHRLNWRAQAIGRFGRLDKGEFAFSAPMTLSKKDFLEVRSKINNLISEIIEIAKDSKPEVPACLNIDWINF
ncbi:MAG: TIGR02147 family protein [Bacteriovoracaceae bacterium]|nr:TIGR02147 family protein [Bacteriovoracaceae bacterium]